MSQADIIRQGMIAQKKQEQMRAERIARANLNSLANDATFALMKPIADVNVEALEAHLTVLKEKREEALRIEREIKELA